jgi:hypothetical protein
MSKGDAAERLAKAKAKLRDTYARAKELEREVSQLERAIRRETFAGSIGHDVRVRYRQSGRDAKLNDAVGKLIAVKVSRATVDFGALGKWTSPIEDLQLLSEGVPQGFAA